MYDKKFSLTNIQLAYLMGRNTQYELGGVSTHAYYEAVTKLDIDKIEIAINKLISSQPMLRTIITDQGEQRILSDTPYYKLESIDISKMTSIQQEKYIKECRDSMAQQIFATGDWPMFKFKALKIDEYQHYFIASLDLLIADGGSLAILFNEIVSYCKYGKEIYSPKTTFEEYVHKIEENRKSARFRKEEKYWKEAVDDFPLAPAIAKEDYQSQSTHFHRLSMRLEGDKWNTFQAYAAEKNASPSNILLYLYTEVLRYWSNQQEFTVNYTISDRKKIKGDIDKVIGDFTSVLPLIVKSDLNSLDLWKGVERIKKSLFNSYRHITCFDGVDVIKLVAKKKGLENTPVLPVVFTSMLFKDRNFDCIDEFGDVTYSVSQTPQVYLDCQIMEIDKQLSLTWDYVEEAFEPEIIIKMFTIFKNLINAVAEKKDNLNEFFELTVSETEIIDLYNDTDRNIPERNLYELILPALKNGKNKCAVKDPWNSLTYQELDKRSDVIAYGLKCKGIGPNDFVAVLAEKNVETIINIIGIVKSGAAYIPIDPNYPEERKLFIMEQSGCKLCLSTDDAKNTIEKDIHIELNPRASGKDIAYVIYTSGSTGVPKGVIITQDSVCNTIQDINERFNVTDTDKVIGISSYCFDLSVFDIFGSLSAMATLVIIPEIRDIPTIVSTVKEERITVWNTVPAIMELFIEEWERKNSTKPLMNRRKNREVKQVALDYNGLRLVMLSGDWIPLGLPQRVWKAFDKAEIYSLGGATEASIWSVYFPIKEIKEGWKSIPYGYPLANQKLYIMNDKGELCPPGIIGEIWIGGRGVAAGYLNEDEKTKIAFTKKGTYGILYHTGDYGVLKKEGYIEFKGRRDAQIKIRGHRIELGEIEHVLLQIAGVEKAVVTNQKRKNGIVYLCAYLVGTQIPSDDEVIIYLEKYLPEYMIPQKIMHISEISLSANGKVDRKNLPSPDDEIHNYQAPRNKKESLVQRIWAEILSVDTPGIYDNFFALGGDSISMVKIASAIETELNQKVSLQLFLKNPTIAGLAENLEEPVTSQTLTQKTKKREIVINDEFPLTEVQMAYLFGGEEGFELGGISAHAYYELETELDIDRFERALNVVIFHQPMLRAVMTEKGQQKILGQELRYIICREDFSQDSPNEQKRKLGEIRNRMIREKINPYSWPLFDFVFIDLGKEENRLLINFNLLIADGTSMRILVEELMAAYHEESVNFEPMTYTFANYVYDKQQIKNTTKWNQDKEYWLDKMIDFPDAPHIARRISNNNELAHYERKEIIISEDEWKVIKEKISNKGVSPSAVLETAYSYVLSYWSDQPHHGINVTVFNREPFHQDVEEMIGDFTSIMLLDVDLKKEKTFWENAETVQTNLIEGMEHNTYDGVEFIRELSKYRNNQSAVLMPYVFTSMIFQDKKFSSIKDFGKIIYSISQTPQVYLDCQVMEINGALSITWDYVTELFDNDMVQKMFTQFIQLIRWIGTEKDFCKNIFELNETDKSMIKKYNETFVERETTTLYKLIKNSLEKGGNQCAIKEGNNSISYKDLDYYSNIIAIQLVRKGIGPRDFVGVIAERKVETIINIIGIVKSGAAYIPIDPNHPKERQNYILKQSNCKLCLEAKHIKNIVYEEHNVDFVTAKGSDPAYVIYTSGSTGVPKGVVITQDAVCNTIMDINNRFHITCKDRILGISSYCFDLSVYDIFGSLAAMATMIIAPDARDTLAISDMVRDEHITVWNTVPAIMELLIKEREKNLNSSVKAMLRRRKILQEISLNESELRVVMLSGDWIPLNLPERIRNIFPKANIYSLGGATEASIWSIYYPITEVRKEWNSIPYGYPLSNQTIYVLNYEGDLCPIESTGEIFIGGRGVAAEYQNEPEKTKNAFINHPYLGRLYRTGDYGTFKKEGYIEFRGRRDNQVKIRGHRIELGEIEQVISQMDKIDHAIVTTQNENTSTAYLCAYIISKDMITEQEVISYASQYLPDYMVPQRVIQLEHLLLNSNGKVDRKSLPKPDEIKVEYIPPRNELEKEIQEIWQEVMEIPKISVLDNYFTLGGDSVMMLQISSKLEDILHKKVSLHAFFQNPSIAGIAAYIRENNDDNLPCYYCNPNQECRYFLFPDISGISTIMHGLIEVADSEGAKYYDIITDRTWNEMIQFYTEDIIRTPRKNKIILIGYSLGGNICYEIALQLEKRQIPVEKIILLDSYFISNNQNIEAKYEEYIKITLDNAKEYKLRSNIQKIFYMIRDYITKGTLEKTPVYYIEAEGDNYYANSLRKDNEKWFHLANSCTRRIKGAGNHTEMLKAPHINENRIIIDQIINKEIK